MVQIGGQIFKNAGDVEEAKYRNYDIGSDNDENVPEPIVTGIVTAEYRQVLKYAPKWTTFPDFEQVRWLNSTIEWLWPGLNKAICKMVRVPDSSHVRFVACSPHHACAHDIPDASSIHL